MQTFNIFLVLIFSLIFNQAFGIDYYFDHIRGNDTNHGKSILSPFKNLSSLENLNLAPGDRILLMGGQTFEGNINLKGVSGSDEHPIEILSYSWGNMLQDTRATIDAKGYANGISLQNCKHIIVKDLIITANAGGLPENHSANMRCGVLVTTSEAGEYSGIVLKNIMIRDIFFEEQGFERGKNEVRTANGSQSYGWGIRVINRTEGAMLRDLQVLSCEVKNVAHTGIKFTGRDHKIEDIKVYNNRVEYTGGPGIQMSGIKNGHIKGNYVDHSGSNNDSRKWGRGSGLWTWGTENVVIENNYFMNANGPGDSAGCHIDFNCRDVVIQYNFSANNTGGFCEILGNNYNCAYRYNISVNDGHRVKGKSGAFQEGKIFWLSGYVGKKKKRHGPYNSYFYNNTIYVSKDIVAKIAVTKTAKGVLVANNIFYIEGESKAVLGDQYVPEVGSSGTVDHVVFQNNLFLKQDFWPKEVLIQPDQPLIGKAEFPHAGSHNMLDYIPQNISLIKNKGIPISPIPNDTIGLKIGLEVTHDILGNKIQGTPDIGAIELGEN